MTDKATKTGEFCWNELMTTDINKAKNFYTSLFGWKTNDHEIGDKTYTMFSSDNKEDIGGLMQIPKEHEGQIPSHWKSYIYVENMDETVEKAKKLGATIVVPPTPVSDFGKFAILQDPTGAHIALWQSLKEC